MKTCVICFDQFGSEAVFKPMLCTHYSCHSCLAGYFIAYQEPPRRDFTAIPCPVPECPHHFKAVGVVHRVLNHQQAQAWWRNAIAHSMGRIGYCPYRNCRGIYESPPPPKSCSWCDVFCRLFFPWYKKHDNRYTQCFKCRRGICVKCARPWHSKGEKCTGKQAYNEATPPRAGYLADAKFHQLAQRQGWTRCPDCGYVVCKTNGCNIVKCRCGKEFCYRCGSNARGHACSRHCKNLNHTELKIRRCINMYRSQL